MMALLSLDRHDVLETIRQSNSLHEAFLRVAKLPAVGEYRTATNADLVRAMTDEELAEWFSIYCFRNKTYDAHCDEFGNCKACWIDWLKEEAT